MVRLTSGTNPSQRSDSTEPGTQVEIHRHNVPEYYVPRWGHFMIQHLRNYNLLVNHNPKVRTKLKTKFSIRVSLFPITKCTSWVEVGFHTDSNTIWQLCHYLSYKIAPLVYQTHHLVVVSLWSPVCVAKKALKQSIGKEHRARTVTIGTLTFAVPRSVGHQVKSYGHQVYQAVENCCFPQKLLADCCIPSDCDTTT